MSEDSHSSIPLRVESQESVVMYNAQPAGEGASPANEPDMAAVKGECKVNIVTLGNGSNLLFVFFLPPLHAAKGFHNIQSFGAKLRRTCNKEVSRECLCVCWHVCTLV